MKPPITNTWGNINNNTNDNQNIIDNTSVLPAFGVSDNSHRENINVTTTTTTTNTKTDNDDDDNADDVSNYDEVF